jgi:uncharacterized RDD family membrane protein YckC
MSGAQRDIQPIDDLFGPPDAAEGTFDLKEQVAERLAAHRARKSRAAGSSVTPISQSATQPSSPQSRSARIAASVAERYAQSQSYRAFLAEEAERAIRQAEAAAEVAAISARAVVEAQNQLLFELDQLAAEVPLSGPIAVPAPEAAPAPPTPLAANKPDLNISEAPSPTFTVRLYEDAGRPTQQPPVASHLAPVPDPFDEAEDQALDEEIAFRQSPVFEPTIAPIEIPANLIEFPRQLVAARKARPRLAEGPLREEADLAPASAQLRIFEVEATQLSPAPVVESVAPEWSSMVLDAQPAPAPFVEVPEAQFLPIPAPQAASLSLRLMSAMVDGILIVAAFFGFVGTFAFTCSKLGLASISIGLQPAAIASIGILLFLALAYQLLFFTFGEATPGMRYARIGLCTLSDENPTRPQIRRRIFATILAACPIGIGFLWACLDDEGLGWHDRISRMYQRSY